jgi:hypothetical protein
MQRKGISYDLPVVAITIIGHLADAYTQVSANETQEPGAGKFLTTCEFSDVILTV